MIDEVGRYLRAHSEWSETDFLTALFWVDEEGVHYEMREIGGASGARGDASTAEAMRLRVVWEEVSALSGREFTTDVFPNLAFRFYSSRELLSLADYDDPGPSPWLANAAWHWRRFPLDVERLLETDQFFCLVTPHGAGVVQYFLHVLQKPAPTLDDCTGVANQRFLATRALGDLGVRVDTVVSALARVVEEEKAHMGEAAEFVRSSPSREHSREHEFHRRVHEAASETLKRLEDVK